MVKHTQTIRRLLLPTNCLSVFDHIVGLMIKGLTSLSKLRLNTYTLIFQIHFDQLDLLL